MCKPRECVEGRLGLNLACEARAFLSPRVVPPHPQGLQGSHLNLSQASAQRHTRYFLLNNKAVNEL